MNTHLFLFTLSPVQSFIAQARKTQDLYAGSAILSCLVKAGIAAFKQEFAAQEHKLIFPGDDTERSLPNRFIGKIAAHTLSDKELRDKAEDIQASIKKQFTDIANEALEKAVTIAPPGFAEQIEAHLEIFWAFEEIKQDDEYATAFKSLEGLSQAIKNVRPFEQFAYQEQAGVYGEVGRKCGMDGINNALFYRPADTTGNSAGPPAYLVQGAKKLPGFTLNPGEGLSAVSLVKRFYLNEGTFEGTFPSTAEIALMHDEENLPEKEKEMFKCYKLLFNKKKLPEACINMFRNDWISRVRLTNPEKIDNWNEQFDYHMLFEENLTTKTIPDLSQLDLVRALHGDLKNHFKTKYYAVVLFDGDQMGKWLSGENNITKQNLEDFHGKLSGLLSQFSHIAYQSIDRSHHNGHAVYAGGDDFLGFVNVHALFKVIAKLRQGFHDTINTGTRDFKKANEHLTFSAGIVIAHYKTPFSEVLKKARAMEKKAKKEGKRNAFGIATLKHSGEVQEAIFKWDQIDANPEGCSNWMALETIVQELDKEEGHFSNSFIQNLTNEFYQLTGADLHDIDDKNRMAEHLENALLFEIKRLVHRSLYKEETPAKDEERKTKLTEAVQALWQQARHPKARNFIHALHIADFITRKTKKQ